MSVRFEEIDRRPTSMGEISLRRRLEPTLLVDVYEVKLDDEFLMSSLFTVAEVELARLALAELRTQAPPASLALEHVQRRDLLGGLIHEYELAA